MSSLRYRANGWDLRYRDRNDRERTERFTGGTSRRAPTAALERKAEVELQMYRGSYVPREDESRRREDAHSIGSRWSDILARRRDAKRIPFGRCSPGA